MPLENEKEDNIFHLIVGLDSLTQVETDSKTGYFWHDKDGQPTENEKEVVERIPVEFPQYRNAETDEDFQTVFDKEFSNNKATDPEIFRKYHIEDVQNILKEYTELESTSGWDYELIERTEKYIRFLNRKSGSSTRPPELNFTDYLKHPDPKTSSKIIKTFSEFFLPQYREALPGQLKNEFQTETGRDIRMLIDVLKDKNIIAIGRRKNKEFYLAMVTFFDRDIAKYQAIFDPKPETFNELDLLPIRKRVEAIL